MCPQGRVVPVFFISGESMAKRDALVPNSGRMWKADDTQLDIAALLDGADDSTTGAVKVIDYSHHEIHEAATSKLASKTTRWTPTIRSRYYSSRPTQPDGRISPLSPKPSARPPSRYLRARRPATTARRSRAGTATATARQNRQRWPFIHRL